MIDKAVRDDFPILNQPRSPVYFDNACMSLRPQSVIDSIVSYYTNMSACAGRSNHHLAAAVSSAVDQSREKVRKFIHAARKDEVVFTRNTSEGLNLVANSIGLQKGDVVVVSDKEHNSNLVPWLRLKEIVGIEVRVVRNNLWTEAIDDRVKVVAFNYTSNLDGTTHPVKEIISLAHAVGAITVVDAAQAAPHQPIDVQDLDVDFLAFSVHKMCGPSGMGVLYGKLTLLEKMNSFLVGGDTVAFTTYEQYEMLPAPEKFEAGLQDYAGIIGTGAAVDYLMKVGLKAIHEHEIALNSYLTEKLHSLSRIKIIGPLEAEKRGGITSFTVDGADHHQVALMFDQVGNVMVRSGQHCVHSWFNDHTISGSVRASFYLYNTMEEIDVFAETLEKILRVV